MNGVPSVNDLRHRITLQSRPGTNDGFGQEVSTWTDVLSCYAAIEPAQRPEQIMGEALIASRTHVVIIRYRPGVNARMRAVYSGRVFEISSVIDIDERHKWLQLDCTEGLTAG